MDYDDFPLHYSDDARSVHVMLRVLDPDSDDRDELLIDNLATAVHIISTNDLTIVEETIGRIPLGDGTHPLLRAWREHASGSPDETLVIVTHGDPDCIREESA